MRVVRQIFLGLLAIAAAVTIWVYYVPGAAPYLERAGVYDLLGLEPPASGGESGRGQFGGGASKVVVASVETGQVNARVSSIGDGRAARSITVRSEATGMIRQLAISPGSFVEEGTLMAQLDDEAERIALERARLQVAEVEGNLQRLRQLSESGTISAVQLRDAELSFRSAELQAEQAAFDLAQRKIMAPISGWVGLLEIDEGDRIGTQDTIAIITDRSSIQIDFRVPERHIAELSVGMPLEVSSLANRDVALTGEIVALDNVVDRASRTLRVQGRVDNPDDVLRAGQAFEVTLSFPGVSLPSVDPLAIQWSGDGSFVWKVDEGVVAPVSVVIRQRNSDSVLVEGALENGDLVVIEGVQSLRPGGEVEVVTGVSALPQETTGSSVARDI